MTLHKEGWRFLLPTITVAGLLLWLFPIMAIVPLGFLVLVLIFFRNPRRTVGDTVGLALAPADGRIIEVVANEAPPIRSATGDDQRYIRISIFLSLLNVHVTRSPVTGQVGRIEYKKGKFFHAATRRGIEQNETNTIEISSPMGLFFVVQSTGALARRIICSVASRDQVQSGQEIGFIRFGSRVDLYAPADATVLVEPGQKIHGGVTSLCSISGVETNEAAFVS